MYALQHRVVRSNRKHSGRRDIELIRKNTVVFGVGPAGTGKTFLAVAMAVKALRDKKCSA